MAAQTLDTFVKSLITDYAKPWAEGVYNNTYMFSRMKQLGRVSELRGSATLTWNVRSSKNTTAGAYTGAGTQAGAVAQGIDKAEIGLSRYKVEVEISGDVLAVAAAGGTGLDPFFTDFEGSLDDLREKISADILVGDGSTNKQLAGLTQCALAISGTYAGINHSQGYWQPLAVDAGAVATTEALVRRMKQRVEDERGGRVTAIWTDSIQWNYLADALGAGRRQDPLVLYGGLKADALWIDANCPVVRIPGYPTARMDFVNEADLDYRIVPPAQGNSIIDKLRNVIAVPGYPEFAIVPQGTVGDSVRLWIIHYCVQAYRNPYRAGLLYNLKAT